MKFPELSVYIKGKLSDCGLTEGEASFEMREMLSYVYGKDPLAILLCDGEVDSDSLKRIEGMLRERQEGRPLAYITGERNFYGYTFEVNEHTLIPRFETELLCETAINKIRERRYESLLDLCTGSGCIAITLNLETGIRADASDVDGDALLMAQKNAGRLGSAVDFIRSDLFQDITGKYDIIVSNPPYISEKDYNSLDRSVRDFEPEKALLAGYDGCDFYRRITEQLKDHLNPGGTVMFEIGYDQGNAVSDMLDKAGFHYIDVIKDYSGFDRIVTGELSDERDDV